MSWRKEHREHPWTTQAQAKQIARDHATKKKIEHKRRPQKGGSPIAAAKRDTHLLIKWGKGVAKKP